MLQSFEAYTEGVYPLLNLLNELETKGECDIQKLPLKLKKVTTITKVGVKANNGKNNYFIEGYYGIEGEAPATPDNLDRYLFIAEPTLSKLFYAILNLMET